MGWKRKLHSWTNLFLFTRQVRRRHQCVISEIESKRIAFLICLIVSRARARKRERESNAFVRVDPVARLSLSQALLLLRDNLDGYFDVFTDSHTDGKTNRSLKCCWQVWKRERSRAHGQYCATNMQKRNQKSSDLLLFRANSFSIWVQGRRISHRTGDCLSVKLEWRKWEAEAEVFFWILSLSLLTFSHSQFSFSSSRFFHRTLTNSSKPQQQRRPCLLRLLFSVPLALSLCLSTASIDWSIPLLRVLLLLFFGDVRHQQYLKSHLHSFLRLKKKNEKKFLFSPALALFSGSI